MPEGKPSILYVDDDPDYLEAMRVILEAGGYAMAEAASVFDGQIDLATPGATFDVAR